MLEEVLKPAAETKHIEVAIIRQTPQEDFQRSLGVIDSHSAHRSASIEQEDVLSLGRIKIHLELLACLCLLQRIINAKLTVFGNEGDCSDCVVV